MNFWYMLIDFAVAGVLFLIAAGLLGFIYVKTAGRMRAMTIIAIVLFGIGLAFSLAGQYNLDEIRLDRRIPELVPTMNSSKMEEMDATARQVIDKHCDYGENEKIVGLALDLSSQYLWVPVKSVYSVVMSYFVATTEKQDYVYVEFLKNFHGKWLPVRCFRKSFDGTDVKELDVWKT